jgi:hypothetical protein
MAKKIAGFIVRERELAKALEITPEQLDEIVTFFDSNPDDEWELRENDHFIFLTEKWQERLFSYHGAFAIAKYMDVNEKKTIWQQIVEFVTKHKAKIRNAFVCQKVIENCSSLTTRNNRHFLAKKDVINILCTSYGRLNKAFEDIQRSNDPMALGEDFDEIEGERHYSLSGLDKFCRVLSAELKNKDRQEWCAAVEFVGKKTLKELISEEEARAQKIKAAMAAARKRDQGRCQITGQKPTKHKKFNLAVHHIFSKEHYPHLAMSLDNLITLQEEVHHEFHAWQGGTMKPCTLEDLIHFVNDLYSDEEQYPEREKLMIRLNKIGQVIKP